MKDIDSAYPVFDATRANSDGSPCEDYGCSDPGMTLSQYAAIHLKVPMSGDPEIDKAIRESRRLDMAGQALAGICAKVYKTKDYNGPFIFEDIANEARLMANTLLAEWEKEARLYLLEAGYEEGDALDIANRKSVCKEGFQGEK
jgi:hypothetical protein